MSKPKKKAGKKSVASAPSTETLLAEFEGLKTRKITADNAVPAIKNLARLATKIMPPDHPVATEAANLWEAAVRQLREYDPDEAAACIFDVLSTGGERPLHERAEILADEDTDIIFGLDGGPEP